VAVYDFTKDSTPPIPGLDRAARLRDDADRFAAALTSGEAWDRFCDGLRHAGRAILRSEDATSDSDLAGGFQYLLGLVTYLTQHELYRTDGDAPAFVATASDVVKVGLDNPDGALLAAPLHDDGVYRVYGRAAAIRMVEFVVSGGARPVMHFLDEFDRASDGTFSITLAAEPHPGNWIQLPTGAHSLLVRRVLYDWDTEEIPHIAIERIGAEASAVPRCLRTPTAAEIGEQIDALGTLIAQNADYWVDFVHSFRDEGDNVVPSPRPLPGTGMNDRRSSVKGFFSLADDEALVVEFEPPSGLFWSVCLGDIWFRTIDYSHHQTSLNGHQVTVDPDGRCRVVIAHRDPGVANWLDTTDHRHGVICLRWVRVDRRPEVHTRVVPFAEIDASLHAGTARVTPAERAGVLARRRSAVARRWAVPLTTRWSYSTATLDPQPPRNGA
jgi:hypothetical protein